MTTDLLDLCVARVFMDKQIGRANNDRLEWAEHRLKTEAAEWVRRFHQMKDESGLHAASGWWLGTIKDIEKRRGKQAADELRAEMNKIKCSQ